MSCSVSEAGARPASATNTDLAWRIVGLTNLYRLLSVLVLVAMYELTQPVSVFGSSAPSVFRAVLAALFPARRCCSHCAGRRHGPATARWC